MFNRIMDKTDLNAKFQKAADIYRTPKTQLKKDDMFEFDSAVYDLINCIKNDGIMGSERARVQMKDFLDAPNLRIVLPEAITLMAQEAIHPLLNISPLFNRVNHQEGMITHLGSWGVVDVKEVNENSSLPEVSPSYGGNHTVATMPRRVGVSLALTEMLMKNQTASFKNLMVEIGRAFARRKEIKALNLLNASGTVVFDNSDVSAGLSGQSTTGRGLDGAYNGSVTVDDLFDVYAQLLQQGYYPDLLIVHPLSWLAFVKDANLRMFAQVNQGTQLGAWMGQVAHRGVQPEYPLGPASGYDPLTAASNIQAAINPGQNSAPVLPNYYGMNFRMIVSPFVPYDHANKTTDIIMADSRYLGNMVIGSNLETRTWENMPDETWRIRMAERYEMYPAEEGKAIARLKNISVKANQVVLPAQAQISLDGTVATAAPTSDL